MTERLGSQRFKDLEEPFGPRLLFRDCGSSWETLVAPRAQTSSQLKHTALVHAGVGVHSGEAVRLTLHYGSRPLTQAQSNTPQILFTQGLPHRLAEEVKGHCSL